jgi:integrating conjugative element relaxase (TIGR03760 family)
MLSWIFHKKKATAVKAPAVVGKDDVPAGFMAPLSAGELLATPRRQKLLAHIWQRTSLSREQFSRLYRQPIERYAELVQQFPASESHHHAYPGGMLDHGLEIVAYAIKLRQSYLLPIGASPEEQAGQSESWTAACAYAALLHDIGKVAVDLHVEYEDGRLWHPWHGRIVAAYRFRYPKDRQYRLHSAASGLLYHQILDAHIMDWLSRVPQLWAMLLYTLAGQSERSGVLGEIVTKADQASVAQALGGDPVKAMAAPVHALQRKLLEGLRYLVKEQLELNNAGPSDGWLTDDALWLVSKTVSDKLRAHLLSQGMSGIPHKNSAIFDVLQEHGVLLPTPADKAIWHAAVNSSAGWHNSFTFLKVAPSLIWDVGDRPQVFAGTVIPVTDNETPDASGDGQGAQAVAVCSEMPQPAVGQTEPGPEMKGEAKGETKEEVDGLNAVFELLGMSDLPPTETDSEPLQTEAAREEPLMQGRDVPTALPDPPESPVPPEPSLPLHREPALHPPDVTPSGEHFMQWLKDAIVQRRLMINDTKALVHTVADTLYIVTPGIFMRYAQEFPAVRTLAKQENENLQEFRWVQKRFEKLKRHKKQPNGLNIWTCRVSGPHRSRVVYGYLLLDPTDILPGVSFNNPYLALLPDDARQHHLTDER